MKYALRETVVGNLSLFSDLSTIKILRHESEMLMRKLPEFNQLEKGRVLLSDRVTFSWNNPSDVEVTVQDNGSKVSIKEMIYIVPAS